MTATYPGGLKSFSQRTDAVDDIMATDINQAYDEIGAIEAELGLDPADKTGGTAGTYATVKARLDKAHRAATFVVAASDASADSKQFADYVCDGTADDVQISAAIAALPSMGGKVVLSEGEFNITSDIVINTSATKLVGQGRGATILTAQTGVTNAVIDIVTNTAAELDDVTVEGIKMDVNSKTVDGIRVYCADATDYYSAWRLKLAELDIRGVPSTYHGIDIDAIQASLLSNIFMNNVGNGLRIRDFSKGGPTGNSLAENISVRKVKQDGIGIDFDSCAQMAGLHLHVLNETNGPTGIVGIRAYRASHVHIDFVDIENVLVGVKCDGTASPFDIAQDFSINGGYIGLKGTGETGQKGIHCTTESAQCNFQRLHLDGGNQAGSIGFDDDGGYAAANRFENGHIEVAAGGDGWVTFATIAGTGHFRGNTPDVSYTSSTNAEALPVFAEKISITTAGAETRTLAAPLHVGQELTLYCKTDGGNCVVTCATTINEQGGTTIVFNETGQSVKLTAIEEGSTLRWRML